MKTSAFILFAFIITMTHSGCKKSSKYDDEPSSTFTGTLTFSPEQIGTYADNQDATTISNISLTGLPYSNGIVDSSRTFAVSFNGKYMNGATPSTIDYVVYLTAKFPNVDLIPPGVYTNTAVNTSSYVGALLVRQSGVPDMTLYSGGFPQGVFSGTVYSSITITKSYKRHLSGGDRDYVDGSIDAVFISGTGASIKSVHITGAFSGTRTTYRY
jgi:hypothetical protein